MVPKWAPSDRLRHEVSRAEAVAVIGKHWRVVWVLQRFYYLHLADECEFDDGYADYILAYSYEKSTLSVYFFLHYWAKWCRKYDVSTEAMWVRKQSANSLVVRLAHETPGHIRLGYVLHFRRRNHFRLLGLARLQNRDRNALVPCPPMFYFSSGLRVLKFDLF